MSMTGSLDHLELRPVHRRIPHAQGTAGPPAHRATPSAPRWPPPAEQEVETGVGAQFFQRVGQRGVP